MLEAQVPKNYECGDLATFQEDATESIVGKTMQIEKSTNVAILLHFKKTLLSL